MLSKRMIAIARGRALNRAGVVAFSKGWYVADSVSSIVYALTETYPLRYLGMLLPHE